MCCDSWGRLLIATGEAIPLRGLDGVPGLPGAPQDEAGLTRKFDPLRQTQRSPEGPRHLHRIPRLSEALGPSQ